MVAVVLGERQVKRALSQMKVSVQGRITRSAQRTALAGLAKEIKAKLPGKYKEARKGIGHSLRKNLAGVHVGKAGVAVGIRGARRTRLLEKLKRKSSAFASHSSKFCLAISLRSASDSSFGFARECRPES